MSTYDGISDEPVKASAPAFFETVADFTRTTVSPPGVAHAGDRHDVVRRTAAVRVVHVPEQARVVILRQRGHEPVAERSLELVLFATDDAVHLVHEQHECPL